MDSELMRFEEELERLSPGSLPEGLIARMEAAMEGWEQVSAEVSEEIDKVVPFPHLEDEERAVEKRGRAGVWAAAACVGMLGAVAGLLLTANPEKNEVADSPSRVASEAVRKAEFAPRTARRTILDSSNRGVIVANGSEPLRVMRLNYVDRVEFRNAAGEEVHLEIPTVNYHVVPLPTD